MYDWKDSFRAHDALALSTALTDSQCRSPPPPAALPAVAPPRVVPPPLAADPPPVPPFRAPLFPDPSDAPPEADPPPEPELELELVPEVELVPESLPLEDPFLPRPRLTKDSYSSKKAWELPMKVVRAFIVSFVSDRIPIASLLKPVKLPSIVVSVRFSPDPEPLPESDPQLPSKATEPLVGSIEVPAL